MVRLVLVPAVIALLGDVTWWAPRWMLRVQQRVGLGEHEPVDYDPPTQPVAVVRVSAPARPAGKHRATTHRPGFPVPRY